MASSSRRDNDYMGDINVTPLVDVMLVLLIVMMVTASFAVTQSLKVNLPSAQTGTSEATPLTLSISPGGQWSLDGSVVTSEAVRERLRRAGTSAGPPHVIVAADDSTAHRHVVAAMDFLRLERVDRISIGVTRAAGAGRP